MTRCRVVPYVHRLLSSYGRATIYRGQSRCPSNLLFFHTSVTARKSFEWTQLINGCHHSLSWQVEATTCSALLGALSPLFHSELRPSPPTMAGDIQSVVTMYHTSLVLLVVVGSQDVHPLMSYSTPSDARCVWRPQRIDSEKGLVSKISFPRSFLPHWIAGRQ